MLVKDFMELCIEEEMQFVQFYDIDSSEIVLECYYDEIPEEYDYLKECEIASWNCIQHEGICFNF